MLPVLLLLPSPPTPKRTHTHPVYSHTSRFMLYQVSTLFGIH